VRLGPQPPTQQAVTSYRLDKSTQGGLGFVGPTPGTGSRVKCAFRVAIPCCPSAPDTRVGRTISGDNGGVSVQSPHVMPVGDVSRPLIRKAAFGTLLASAIFFMFTATKQSNSIYFHAPWVNDPYDTVFSFTMFFVPLLAATVLVQLSLCRKSEPLPTARVVTILRGCRIALAAMTIELLSAWVSVALEANRSEWTAATTVLIALLTLCSVVTGKVIVDVVRLPHLRSPDRVAELQESDWLADLVIVAQRQSRWLGPLRRPGLSVVVWTDRAMISKARRHPVGAAAVTSAAFAVTVFGWQAIREGYLVSVTSLEMGLGFCGMFAFLILAGAYLGIVRSPIRSYGAQRRAIDASVAASIVAVATLAFRDWLWWIVGSNAITAGRAQFAALVGGTSLLAFVMVFTSETLWRSHSWPAS
jgi:hypothetical protein